MVAAPTMSLIAVALGLAYATQAANAADHELLWAELSRTQAAMTEALGDLAKQMCVADDEVPEGLLADVYKLGQRSRGQGADGA